MKQIRFLLIALCVISMTSCTKDEPQTNFEDIKDNQFKTELAERIYKQATTQTESYIIYIAETGEWITINDKDEHDLLYAIATFLSNNQGAKDESIDD